jgi:hypothetical protein
VIITSPRRWGAALLGCFSGVDLVAQPPSAVFEFDVFLLLTFVEMILSNARESEIAIFFRI